MIASNLPDNDDAQNIAKEKARFLLHRYQEIRRFTEELCEPLETEDYIIQSMPDVSPTKWHLAHTSWFFENFILIPFKSDYSPLHPQYGFLFNSYYKAVGEHLYRPNRGLLSRPTVKEVYCYRNYVDEHLVSLLETVEDHLFEKIAPFLEIGIHHEQQHQELLLTDIKHVFSVNPLRPSYSSLSTDENRTAPVIRFEWIEFSEGTYQIGHQGEGFCYDNELPVHRVFLEPFRIASRAVTNGEFLEFMENQGYQKPELWLSNGWDYLQQIQRISPWYWEKRDGQWCQMTLSSMKPLNLTEPVCHVNYYEADAYATWAGARLPTEQEWEVASNNAAADGNFVESQNYHPVRTDAGNSGASIRGMFGDTWEWTSSHYSPYPGFQAAEGTLGEYNGKFMCGQFVLRGGSCVTSQTHIRPTYRNFFPPDAFWQFTGIRLANNRLI